MKYATRITKILMITVLTLGLIWSLCGPVHAEWYVTQGTAGKVQDPSKLTRQDIYYGWGMEIMLKAWNTTWVHFPIQMPYPSYVRYIGIDVRIENSKSFIDEIHVWAGDNKLHEFKNLGWQGVDNYNKILDMGILRTPKALGISVKIGAGFGEGHFEIKMVGAGS
jgi:hypothetical protein